MTATDIDIIRHLAQEKSYKQVALALGLAESTVKNRVTVLIQHFGASTQMGVVLRAFKDEVLTLDELLPDY